MKFIKKKMHGIISLDSDLDLHLLSKHITNNIDMFLDHFNISCLSRKKNMLIGCCPIHGGDNQTER